MNFLFFDKVKKFSCSLNGHIDLLPIMLNIEPKMVIIFLSTQSFKHTFVFVFVLGATPNPPTTQIEKSNKDIYPN